MKKNWLINEGNISKRVSTSYNYDFLNTVSIPFAQWKGWFVQGYTF